MIFSVVEFEHWLEQFINFARPNRVEENLIKMQALADEFGNPQNTYKSIHVAGSKGKGSVSTMIASILKEAEFKTGLYTSPHIVDFRERVSLAGGFFSDEEYSTAFSNIKTGFERLVAKNPELDPTWFEVVTMLAFVIFKQTNVDWGIFEVGMGGRLDTTNILHPEACVIMPIELEHCKYLGDTIEKIAFEKAGIIKNNLPVFCAEQNPRALGVIREVAKKRNAQFFYLPELVDLTAVGVSTNGLEIQFNFKPNAEFPKSFTRPIHTHLKLLDEIQAKNACVATGVVKFLLPEISAETIEAGLAKAWIQGRFELFSSNPLVIIDGAHTKNSIQFCLDTYTKLAGKNSGVLVFACADDKDTAVLAPLFKGLFSKIYLTIPGVFKKSNINKIVHDFKAVFSEEQLVVNEDYKDVILTAYNESIKMKVPLLYTGSFYLAGETKNLLNTGKK